MKKIKIVSILIVFFLISCGSGNNFNEVDTKEDYFKLKESYLQCIQDFKDKNIDEDDYASAMRTFGDTYFESEIIPPDIRYSTALSCYKTALRYDRDDEKLNDKIKKIENVYNVATK